LFSFGKNFEKQLHSEYYSKFYYSIQYFLTTFFPSSLRLEVSRSVNFIFFITGICGYVKFIEQIFEKNKNFSLIFFYFILVYPILFGHSSINSKDIIIFCSHAWCSYFLIKYLNNQNKQINYKFIIFFSIFFSIGTGIQFYFIGTFIPLFIYFFFIFVFNKKKIKKNLISHIFFKEIILLFILNFAILIFFWPETHKNIISLPIEYLFNNLSIRGYPFNLINGEIFFLNSPIYYFYIFFFFQSPEYIIFLYIFFFIYLILKFKSFIKKYQKNFSEVLFFFIVLIYPIIIVFFFKIKPYDSMRHFIWIIPYFLVIPSLFFYFILRNLKNFTFKIFFFFLFFLKFIFIFNFISISPYHYSYFNFFSGPKEDLHKKFEIDFWSTSLKELIKNIPITDLKNKKIASCGLNSDLANKYFIKYHNYHFKFTNMQDNPDYIILINRVQFLNNILVTCDNNFIGIDILKVERNNQIFSLVRKLN